MKGKNFNISCLILMLFLSLPLISNGQSKIITGTVLAKSDNLPLTGATVQVKGTSVATGTDVNGKYSINAASGDVLIVSFIGFISQEANLNNRSIIDFVLVDDVSLLSEVVVTGYGKQTREKLTTSISKLDTRILETSSRANAATALQGTVAGLRVTNTTGQPGSTPSIVLRGGTNFGNDSPLILVDGIPSSFYALNSDDIESIEVLKDAAATAIYGARSANGVILVTTKTGKVGQSNINYKFRLSTNKERDDQQYIGAADHLNYNRQSIAWYRQSNNNPGSFGAFLDGNNGAGTGNNSTNDPFTSQYLTPQNQHFLNQPGWSSIPDILNPSKEILFYDDKGIADRIYQKSVTKDHYLSFDGGNEKGTYFLGMGYLDNDGLALGSGFKRYSGKFSGSYKITKKFRANSTILYSHSNLSRSPLGADDTIFRRFQGQPSTSRTYDSNPDGTFSNIYSVGQNQGFGNPLYYQDKFIRKNLEQRLSGSVGFDYDVIKDLTLSLNASHFAINNHDESFNKAYRTGSTTGPLQTGREAGVSLGRTLRNQLTGTANYIRDFGSHNLNLLVGAEYYKDNYFGTSAGTRNSPTDLIQTLNAAPEANGIPTSSETEYVISSTFGRLLYDYNNKYLAGFTYRYDGSSRLGNNKFGFFPGVSFGWNLHNEEFFNTTSLAKTISKVKPRISYGVNGNQSVLSNYGVFGSYGSQGVYNGQTGYGNTSLPTLDLKWEKSTTLNVGLDISFFNDRLSIITDVYTRDIKDKLATLTLPYYTGFGGILTNNGTYRNKGFEFQVNGDIIKKKDLNWNVGATLTTNKNYVVKLPENANDLNRQGGQLIWNTKTGKEEWIGGLQEGQRYGGDLVISYIQEGIYATQEAADKDNAITDQLMPGFSRNKRWAGDVKWKDVNNDGIINSLDREVIGRTTPSLLGGVSSNLSYKNINLFVKTDFATGHLVWNHMRNKGYGQTQGNLEQPIEVLESWTPTNTITEWPRFVFVNGTKNVWRGDEGDGFNSSGSLLNAANNKFWEKGDYLALREVTLSYDLSSQLFKNHLKRFNVYFTGSNLLYFTGFSGDSPEDGGVQYGTFPMPKTYTVGLNLTF